VKDLLLLFLGRAGGFDGWLRLEAGAVSARGPGLDGLAPIERETFIAGIAPGEEVAIHWLDLPANLAPAQAAAAARLAASDYSAQPPAGTHVAVGSAERDGGLRCVALASMGAAADWLARMESAGFDPDLILPETLLLPPPADGMVHYDRGGIALHRGREEAFAVEPELAALVLAGREVVEIDIVEFEEGLAEAVANPLVNLRQGPFARRRQWQPDRSLIRRLALLAASFILATLAIQIVSIMRYSFAADALEAETRRVASTALPRNAGINDASAELGRRLSELRGGGIGFSAIAAPLFGAVRATANAEISALVFSPDGVLKATIQADTPATIAALAERLEADGFAVASGPLRSGGGRQVAELEVRPK
jgi:general secretion pathway protein L